MMSLCERGAGELLKIPDDALTSVLSKLTVEDLVTVGRTCRLLQVLSNEDQLWMQFCKEWEGEVNLAEWRRLVHSAKALFRLLRYFSKVVGVWSARQLYPRGGILHITWDKGVLAAFRILPKGANSLGSRLFQQTSFVRTFELVAQPDGTAKAYKLCTVPTATREPGCFVWTSPAKDCFHFQMDSQIGEQNLPGFGDTGGPMERQLSILESNDLMAYPRLQTEERRLIESLQQRFLLPHRAYGADHPLAPEGADLRANNVGQRALRYLMRLANRDDGSIACHRGVKTEYRKLILEKPGPGKELSGLWSGVYGPHGLEVAEVCYTDQEIVATKILGDPNVPSGEVTFKVALDSETTDIPDSTRTLAGALMSGAMNGSTPPALVKMYRGHGRIADHNYANPQWVNGRLIVDCTGNLSFLWEDANFLIQFQRFNLEEWAKK